MSSANDRKERVSASSVRYVFDGFEIDPANRTLVRDGKPIPVTGKVFDVLVIFAENPGRLLEKDELIQRIWNDAFVEEGNLARCVSNLRKALGDVDREHKYVSTVQGRGYRFVAPVSTSSGPVEPIATPQATPPARSARRHYWFMGAGLAGVAAIILAFIGFSGTRTAKPHISPIEQIRLTTGGKAGKAILAPDGNSVVYTENQELKVKDLRNGSSRVLASAEPGNTYIALASPPKGQHVYFTTRPDRSIVSLYRIPFSGGATEKVLEGVYGGISFSPDGSKFAFLRRYPELNAYGLIIADADGSNLRNVALTHRPNNFDGIPTWSPDGHTILCSSIKTDGGFHYTILEVSVASGAIEEISTRNWAWLGSLAWLPGSRELLIVAQDADAPNAQVWRLNRSTRETVRITDDTYIYESISGSLDGEKFVAIKKRLESHVWIISETPAQVTTGFDKYDGVGGFAWAPKSQLYFHSRASGRDAIWRMNSDGSGAEQITPDGGSGFTLSPDGRYLVFQKLESTGLGLSRMDFSNGQVERLTERSTDMTPQFTPDGLSVVYCNFDEKHSLYKIATRGGQPAKLFDEYRTVSSPAVSGDGKRIAFSFARAQNDSIRSGIAVISADDNRLLSTFDAKISFGTIYERPTVQWSPDGRYLNYILLENGVSNVCRIDTVNGTVSEVTTFKSGRVFNFAFSSDGSRLAIARGGVESDVLVLKPTD